MTGNDPTRPTGAAPANPALAALGDRLEQAAGTAIATGGTPPGGRSWARLAFLPVLALFVAAGVLIATLVPGGGGRSAEAAVVSAAQATTDASTGRFAVTVAAEGGGVGEVEVSVDGAYDLDADRYRTTMDLGAALAGQPGADLLEGQDLSVDTVIAGSDVYVRLGPAAELFGAEWLRMSVPEMAEQQPAPSLAPGAFLDSLEGVADLEEVGREAVRGVETTHYRGTISLEEAYASLPPDDREQLESALGGAFGDLELPDVPVEVWVGDDDLVRRVTLSVDGSGWGRPGGAPDVGATVTVEYFDIGEPVDIPVPPPDQVASLDDLLGDLFGDLEGFLDDFDLGEPGAGGPGIEEFFGDLEEGLGEELEEFFGGTLPPPPGDQPGQQTPGAPSPDPPEDGPGTPGSGPPPAEDDRAPTTASTLEI